jgi:hypothetical protein
MRKHPVFFELSLQAEADSPPPYRFKWNLAADPRFAEGVLYMAKLNPREPAAMIMAGIAVLQRREYHLAIGAFERAVKHGAPQGAILQAHMSALEQYIADSHKHSGRTYSMLAVMIVGAMLLVGLGLLAYKRFFAR